MNLTEQGRNQRRLWFLHGWPVRWRAEECPGRRGVGFAGQAEVVLVAAELALDTWGGEAVRESSSHGGRARRKDK